MYGQSVPHGQTTWRTIHSIWGSKVSSPAPRLTSNWRYAVWAVTTCHMYTKCCGILTTDLFVIVRFLIRFFFLGALYMAHVRTNNISSSYKLDNYILVFTFYMMQKRWIHLLLLLCSKRASWMILQTTGIRCCAEACCLSSILNGLITLCLPLSLASGISSIFIYLILLTYGINSSINFAIALRHNVKILQILLDFRYRQPPSPCCNAIVGPAILHTTLWDLASCFDWWYGADFVSHATPTNTRSW